VIASSTTDTSNPASATFRRTSANRARSFSCATSRLVSTSRSYSDGLTSTATACPRRVRTTASSSAAISSAIWPNFAHGRVGVLEDSGVVLTPGELDAFGFTPGVGEPNGGWADSGYRERRHPV
jgi:hypothetical protein